MRRGLLSSSGVLLFALAVTLPLVAQPTAPTLQVFFGNLHSHTSYSDGVETPEVAYEHAREVADIDFLAITEHNHAQAGQGRIARDPTLYSGATSVSLISAANRFTEDGEFVAIYGQEFSSISSGNHANVFEVNEVIDVANGDYGSLLRDWLPNNLDSTGQQALLLLNHPDTSSSPDNKEYGIDDFPTAAEWRAALDARAELINIINGPSHTPGTSLQPGRPSESEFRRYLNLGFHLAPTADQDNHRPNWGDATEARTAVIAPELTKSAILAALRARHVYATEDRNLRLIGHVNGQLFGSQLSGASVPPVGSPLTLTLSIVDDDEPLALYRIEVFADQIGGDEAEIVTTLNTNGNGTVTIPNVLYDGGAQYIFLRVFQSNDDDEDVNRAWTAPVWFEPGIGTSPPPGGVSAAALTVDLAREEARVTNMGDQQLNLTGWVLVSVQGGQRFTFPSGVVLAPNQFVLVTSGPRSSSQPPAILRWSQDMKYVWNNDGDPAELYDADGHLIIRIE